MSWKEFVQAVGRADFDFPWQRPLIIAQAILESGRGTTELSKYKNLNGMKYRESIAIPGAEKFQYYTSSEKDNLEHPGWDWFFKFDTYATGIEVWKKFYFRKEGNWIPYPKAYNHDPEVLKNARSFLNYVAPIYCPYFEKTHEESYADYIMNRCFLEAERLLQQEGENMSSYWVQLFPDGDLYLMEEPGSHAREKISTGRVLTELITAAQKFSVKAGTYAVASAEKPEPIIEPIPNGAKKVLLDPGHSEQNPGARGPSPDIQEEDFNRLQAQIVKAELERKGVVAEIYDPLCDDLMDIGKHAKDFDMFISLHHNATQQGGIDPYTCVMVHQTYAKDASRQFAKQCAKKIAAALNHKLFQGTLPGVYPAGLSVLNGAEHSGCKGPCVLTESFFIDAYSDKSEVEERSRKAALAIASATLDWLDTH